MLEKSSDVAEKPLEKEAEPRAEYHAEENQRPSGAKRFFTRAILPSSHAGQNYGQAADREAVDARSTTTLRR